MKCSPCARRAPAAAVLLLAAACAVASAKGPLSVPTERKHRIVVMTDIGGDPDDQQSLVRFLLYACDFEVEGLTTGFGHGHDKDTRPELIRRGVEAYGQVLPNLRKHRADYPPAEKLMGLIKDGHNGDPHTVGEGMDSAASEWIIRVLDRDDPRPVWFSIWGGPRELAQAVWKAARTRSKEQLAAFKKKIRVHSIADQDRTAGWVKQNHPDVFWIFSDRLFRGIWAVGDQEIVSPAWLERNVRTGHGPLGPLYPAKASGKDGVKEGDTPSFLYLLPDGLSDPERPEWGNWGGRFRRSGRGSEYVPDPDVENGRPNLYYTLYRWRTAYQNAFEARMDWCVKPFGQANHEPAAVCNGDTTIGVLKAPAEPGGRVKLSAAGSSDPDGDSLSCRWWVYREAGSFPRAASIEGADGPEAVLTVPAEAAGRTIHVILEVTDNGTPPLTAYRRVVVSVSGEPVAGLGGDAPGKPVTSLPGPPAGTGPWEFCRGVNVNGPAVEIDGRKWEGDGAAGFVCGNKAVDSPHVRLRPPTDEARAKMIHSFRYDRQASLTLTDLAAGRYAVYAYVWEDNDPETFDVLLNGRRIQRDVYSGGEGQWQRLGPWVVQVRDGSIRLTSRGGAANFSGIEIWRHAGKAAK